MRVGFVLLHIDSRFLRDDEGTDQIDPDDALEALCRPGTFAPERASGRGDARAVDRERNATHEIVCGPHRGPYRLLTGNVRLDEHRAFAQFAGCRRTLLGINVEQYRLTACFDNAFCGGEAESRSAAGDDRFGCR